MLKKLYNTIIKLESFWQIYSCNNFLRMTATNLKFEANIILYALYLIHVSQQYSFFTEFETKISNATIH